MPHSEVRQEGGQGLMGPFCVWGTRAEEVGGRLWGSWHLALRRKAEVCSEPHQTPGEMLRQVQRYLFSALHTFLETQRGKSEE